MCFKFVNFIKKQKAITIRTIVAKVLNTTKLIVTVKMAIIALVMVADLEIASKLN